MNIDKYNARTDGDTLVIETPVCEARIDLKDLPDIDGNQMGEAWDGMKLRDRWFIALEELSTGLTLWMREEI